MGIADAHHVVGDEVLLVDHQGVARGFDVGDRLLAVLGQEHGIEYEDVGLRPARPGGRILRGAQPGVHARVALRSAELDGQIDVVEIVPGDLVVVDLNLDVGDRRVLLIQDQVHFVHVVQGHLAVSHEAPDQILQGVVVGHELHGILRVVVEEVVDVPLGDVVVQEVAGKLGRRGLERRALRQESHVGDGVAVEHALEDLVVETHDGEIVVHVVVLEVEQDHVVRVRGRLQVAFGIHHVAAGRDLRQEVVHGPLGDGGYVLGFGLGFRLRLGLRFGFGLIRDSVRRRLVRGRLVAVFSASGAQHREQHEQRQKERKPFDLGHGVVFSFRFSFGI